MPNKSLGKPISWLSLIIRSSSLTEHPNGPPPTPPATHLVVLESKILHSFCVLSVTVQPCPHLLLHCNFFLSSFIHTISHPRRLDILLNTMAFKLPIMMLRLALSCCSKRDRKQSLDIVSTSKTAYFHGSVMTIICCLGKCHHNIRELTSITGFTNQRPPGRHQRRPSRPHRRRTRIHP